VLSESNHPAINSKNSLRKGAKELKSKRTSWKPTRVWIYLVGMRTWVQIRSIKF